MMKMQKNAKTVLSAVLTAMFALCALFSAAFYRPVRAAEEAVVLSDGGAKTTVLDVNPVANDPNMPEGGIANMPAGCVEGGAAGFDSRGYMVTADNPPPAIPAGSSDDKVMYFEMLDSHQGLARLEFTQTVRAEKVGSIRIKMYISLDDDVSSAALIKGKHYLMADRYDMQNRYWYELGLRCNQQMQWITIEISGSDVMRLADEEGNIGALYLYYDTYSHAEKPSKSGHIFIDEISYTLATEENDEGGGTCLTTLSPRTAMLDTNPKANDGNIPNGLSNMPVGCIGGGGGFGTRAMDMAVLPAGSSDGYGYSFEIVSSHQSLAHIAFMQYKDGESTPYSVPAAQIGTLTLKMYIDVETDATAGTAVNGKYYLLADRYDMQNQYWFELSFTRDTQRQWIEVEISGSDIMRLADEDGNIGGLYFYYDTYIPNDKPTGGTIYIDEITYTPAEEGAHEGGDPYLTTMSMYTSVLDADPKNNDAYLLEHGFANMPAGFLYGSGGGFGTRVTNMAALPEGSSDGEGLAFEIQSAGQEIAHIAFTRYANGAVTPYSVEADIYGITVKMYVDVETDASAGTAVNGKYYLLADRYDMQNQYWYELNFTRDMQRQWIYVHIKGEDLARLADEDGNIGGLYFYYDTYSDSSARPTGGKIYIDEIRFDDYTVQKTGGDAQESQTMLYGQTVSELTPPAKEGHDFAGWQTQEGVAATGTQIFGVDITGDITLVAQYTVNEYTLTFVVEGGTVAPITQDYGTAVTEPQAPVKEGYTFLGWFEEGEDEAFVFNTMPARNITLTAKYEINEYTLTFVVEGGTVAPITQNYGTAVTEPQAPVKEGYTFLGWFEDGEDEAFVFSTMPARNITLTARYEINEYTLTFVAEGGTVAPITQNYGTAVTAPQAPVKEGYTFLGWFEEGEDEAFVFSTMPARNITLTARYEINEYTVTVKADGREDITFTKQYGGKIAEADLSEYIPDGFVFGGLFTDAALTQPYDTDAAVNGDITLYVRWTQAEEENPGTENPGEENPGGENPGEENPGTENPGTENPGGDDAGGCSGSAAGGAAAAGLAAVTAGLVCLLKKKEKR